MFIVDSTVDSWWNSLLWLSHPILSFSVMLIWQPRLSVCWPTSLFNLGLGFYYRILTTQTINIFFMVNISLDSTFWCNKTHCFILEQAWANFDSWATIGPKIWQGEPSEMAQIDRALKYMTDLQWLYKLITIWTSLVGHIRPTGLSSPMPVLGGLCVLPNSTVQNSKICRVYWI